MIRAQMRSSAALLTLVAAVTAAPTGHTDERGTAKAQFELGKQLFETERYKEAAAAFRNSLALYPTVSGHFNLANCLYVDAQYQEAVAVIQELKASYGATLDPVMKREIEALDNNIARRAARLRVRVNETGATVAVNAVERGVSPLKEILWLPPGDHVIAIEKPGFETQIEQVTLRGGELFDLHATLERSAVSEGPEARTAPAGPPPSAGAAPPRPRSAPVAGAPEGERSGLSPRTWAVISGAAALGVAAGALLGVAAKHYGDFQEHKAAFTDPEKSDEEAAPYDRRQLEERAVTMRYRRLSLGFGAAAGAAAAAGVVLLFLDLKHQKKEKRSAATLCPGGAGVGVMF